MFHNYEVVTGPAGKRPPPAAARPANSKKFSRVHGKAFTASTSPPGQGLRTSRGVGTSWRNIISAYYCLTLLFVIRTAISFRRTAFFYRGVPGQAPVPAYRVSPQVENRDADRPRQDLVGIDPQFSDSSYGFRSGRRAHDAVERASHSFAAVSKQALW